MLARRLRSLLLACLAWSLIDAGAIALGRSSDGVDPSRLGDRVAGGPAAQRAFRAPTRSAEDGAPPEPAHGFRLNRVKLLGASALRPDEWEELIRPVLGRRANAATLEWIARRLTEEYRARGYLLAKAGVAGHDRQRGEATIEVVEGYVAEVEIEGGDRLVDHLDLLASLRQGILAMRPLHGPTLERYLLTFSQTVGFKAEAILEPMPRNSSLLGAVRLVLKITRRAGPSRVTLDNFGSRYTGPFEASATRGIPLDLIGFDTLTLSTLASVPWDEARFISVDYHLLLTPGGADLGVYLNHSATAPGYHLAQQNIQGHSDTLGVRASYPIDRDRSLSWDVSPALELREIGDDASKLVLYRDHIRAVRLANTLTYANAFGGTTTANIQLSAGLPLLGASRDGAPDLSRVAGRGDFSKIEGCITHRQSLPGAFSLYVAAEAQQAWVPLLASEQLGLGGPVFGRAYDPSEFTGDDGLAGLVELSFRAPAPDEHLAIEPFVYYDLGSVWNDGQSIHEGVFAASTGLGTRVSHDSGPFAMFLIALPLGRPVEDPTHGNGKSPRLLLQVGADF